MVRSSHIFRVHTTTYPSNPKPQLNFRPTPQWCLQRQTQRSCSPPSSPAVVSFDFAFLILFAFPGVHFPFFFAFDDDDSDVEVLAIAHNRSIPASFAVFVERTFSLVASSSSAAARQRPGQGLVDIVCPVERGSCARAGENQ